MAPSNLKKRYLEQINVKRVVIPEANTDNQTNDTANQVCHLERFYIFKRISNMQPVRRQHKSVFSYNQRFINSLFIDAYGHKFALR